MGGERHSKDEVWAAWLILGLAKLPLQPSWLGCTGGSEFKLKQTSDSELALAIQLKNELLQMKGQKLDIRACTTSRAQKT